MKIIHLFNCIIIMSSYPLLAKKSPYYVPSPKEVLTKAEYKEIYVDTPYTSEGLDIRWTKLNQLRNKTTDPYKQKGIDRDIHEVSVQINALK